MHSPWLRRALEQGRQQVLLPLPRLPVRPERQGTARINLHARVGVVNGVLYLGVEWRVIGGRKAEGTVGDRSFGGSWRVWVAGHTQKDDRMHAWRVNKNSDMALPLHLGRSVVADGFT